MTKMVNDKDKNRTKLLGQREMLMKSLKKLGFKNLGEAKKISTKIKNELIKMDDHYTKGKTKFIDQYEHLLT